MSDTGADWLPPRAADAAAPPTYDGTAAPGHPFEAPSPASRRTVAGYRGSSRAAERKQSGPAPALPRGEAPASQPATPPAGGAPSTALGGRRREPVGFRRPARGEQRSNGTARAALSIAITSIVLVVLTLGQACVISGPLSGTAWYLSVLARRRVATGELSGGFGLARNAQRLAIVGVVLAVVAAIVWIVLLAVGYTPQDMERDLREWRDDLQQSR